ncbi:MAG: DUF3459 domain-containing protein, partial [Clostridia bacterium]|nr:DUF3459 domain-containing protein [Clostridia bacterium]
NWYRRLIALRALAPELARGEMAALDAGNDALCAFTVGDGTTVVVLANLSQGEPASVDLPALGLGSAVLLGCAGVTEEEFLGEIDTALRHAGEGKTTPAAEVVKEMREKYGI